MNHKDDSVQPLFDVLQQGSKPIAEIRQRRTLDRFMRERMMMPEPPSFGAALLGKVKKLLKMLWPSGDESGREA